MCFITSNILSGIISSNSYSIQYCSGIFQYCSIFSIFKPITLLEIKLSNFFCMLYCFFCVNSLHENSNKHFALLERISSRHNFSNRLYHTFVNKSRHSLVYHQFRRNCISSTRSVVYHQAAGGCTLTRDEIQGRQAALDDIHDCVVMICQACGLDKQKQNICR